jgi:hypothetical protein
MVIQVSIYAKVSQMISSFPNFASNIFGFYRLMCVAQTFITLTLIFYHTAWSSLSFVFTFLSFFNLRSFLSSVVSSSFHPVLQSGLLAATHGFTNGVVEG